VQDQENLAVATKEARAYRLAKENEWKETYQQWMVQSAQANGRSIPRVIVVSAERKSDYLRDWKLGVIYTIEQGLTQRKLEVQVADKDFYRHYHQRVETQYNLHDADYLCTVLIQDLDSSVKVSITLRSLSGKTPLLKGDGQVSYYRDRESYRYGPSRDERRERAATHAAKKAVFDLFKFDYKDTFEAG
jgi:hypothetical protein